jgi:hypothetical protein
MNTLDRLFTFVSSAPPGTLVPVEALRTLLVEGGEGRAASPPCPGDATGAYAGSAIATVSVCAGTWRTDAAVLRRYGAAALADLLERCAADLGSEQRARLDALVTLDEAVQFTGFTRGHLRRLCRSGKLANVGTEAEPAFRFAALPRKTGTEMHASAGQAPSPAMLVEAVLAGKQGRRRSVRSREKS